MLWKWRLKGSSSLISAFQRVSVCLRSSRSSQIGTSVPLRNVLNRIGAVRIVAVWIVAKAGRQYKKCQASSPEQTVRRNRLYAGTGCDRWQIVVNKACAGKLCAGLQQGGPLQDRSGPDQGQIHRRSRADPWQSQGLRLTAEPAAGTKQRKELQTQKRKAAQDQSLTWRALWHLQKNLDTGRILQKNFLRCRFGLVAQLDRAGAF